MIKIEVMKNKIIHFPAMLFILLASIVWLQSCSEDGVLAEDNEIIAEEPIPEEPVPEEPDFTPEGFVEVFNADKVDDNYILVNDAAANRVYLMDKEARLLHEWGPNK